MEHKITLQFGYTDKKGNVHKDVVFGKRLTVQDIVQIEGDPRSKNPTNYLDLIARASIVKFGSLKCPPLLDVLLDLNSIDREDIFVGMSSYLEQSKPTKEIDYTDDHKVLLNFGFAIGDSCYDIVEFGKLTTGRDEVEADRLKLTGVARECFMIDRQIKSISTTDGSANVELPLGMEMFEALDAEDFNMLRNGARAWRLSFRIGREAVSRVRNGDAGDDASAGITDAGGGGSVDAAGTDEDVSHSSRRDEQAG
jgi:hypothetical protein